MHQAVCPVCYPVFLLSKAFYHMANLNECGNSCHVFVHFLTWGLFVYFLFSFVCFLSFSSIYKWSVFIQSFSWWPLKVVSIHPFTHNHTECIYVHSALSPSHYITLCNLGVQYLAQGHLGTRNGGEWDQTISLVSGWPALPPEPQCLSILWLCRKIINILQNRKVKESCSTWPKWLGNKIH